MSDIKAKILATRDQFRELVWPMWCDRFGSSELISVEGSDRPFEQRADTGGIDAFFARRKDGVIIPLASRIEYATSDDIEVSRRLRRRFTVRSQKLDQNGWHKNTELRRLLLAAKDPISRRYLPYRTFHTLLSKDKSIVLFTSAVCTERFCDYLLTEVTEKRYQEQTTRDGDAKFLVIYVDALRAGNIDVESMP